MRAPQRVSVTVSVREITEQVVGGLDANVDALAAALMAVLGTTDHAASRSGAGSDRGVLADTAPSTDAPRARSAPGD